MAFCGYKEGSDKNQEGTRHALWDVLSAGFVGYINLELTTHMEHGLINPHGFDEYKLAHESKQKAVDRLLTYQADTRQRVDTLVKAVFALSGGALTISIGIFLKSGAPHLSPSLLTALRWSWGLLFYSLAASSALIFFMICQGYWHGWQWEKALQEESDSISGRGAVRVVRVCNWVLGITGFVSFLVGLALLAYVSAAAVA